MAPRERREKKRIGKEARGEAGAAEEEDEVGGGMGAGGAGVSAASRCSLLSPRSRSRRVRTERRGWTQRYATRRQQGSAKFASSPFLKKVAPSTLRMAMGKSPSGMATPDPYPP